MPENNFYCGLYVDADISAEEFAFLLGSVFNTKPDKWNNLRLPEGELSVTENDEYNENEKYNTKRGFLFFRYLLEVEPNPILNEGNAVCLVAKILEFLWSKGYAAVATCDYENKLPSNKLRAPKNFFSKK